MKTREFIINRLALSLSGQGISYELFTMFFLQSSKIIFSIDVGSSSSAAESVSVLDSFEKKSDKKMYIS